MIMAKLAIAFCVAALCALLAVCTAARGAEVDVALVLAADASASMNAEDRVLQREGYAAAMESPEVVALIERGRHRRIAVVMFEWGAVREQEQIVPWTIIDSPDAAARVARLIRSTPPIGLSQTSITGALRHAATLLGAAPAADRRVVDVSGDGPDNGGFGLREARAALIDAGITINGLPILGDPAAGVVLDDYYAEFVAGGEGSFVIPANGFADFARAFRAKLMTEIAAHNVSRKFASR